MSGQPKTGGNMEPSHQQRIAMQFLTMSVLPPPPQLNVVKYPYLYACPDDG